MRRLLLMVPVALSAAGCLNDDPPLLGYHQKRRDVTEYGTPVLIDSGDDRVEVRAWLEDPTVSPGQGTDGLLRTSVVVEPGSPAVYLGPTWSTGCGPRTEYARVWADWLGGGRVWVEPWALHPDLNRR